MNIMKIKFRDVKVGDMVSYHHGWATPHIVLAVDPEYDAFGTLSQFRLTTLSTSGKISFLYGLTEGSIVRLS